MREKTNILDEAGLDATILSDIAAALPDAGSLDEVLRWARARTPPARVLDVVVQDEFTHDVVIALSDRIVLVYDTT